jgi:hypothetical protein
MIIVLLNFLKPGMTDIKKAASYPAASINLRFQGYRFRA